MTKNDRADLIHWLSFLVIIVMIPISAMIRNFVVISRIYGSLTFILAFFYLKNGVARWHFTRDVYLRGRKLYELMAVVILFGIIMFFYPEVKQMIQSFYP